MQIRQIRNATIKIHYGGKVFLIDPWLAPKDGFGCFAGLPESIPFKTPDSQKTFISMPICPLPTTVDEILADVDYYIVTHIHPDHIDMEMDGTVGNVLNKETPILVQNDEDAQVFVRSGFKDVAAVWSFYWRNNRDKYAGTTRRDDSLWFCHGGYDGRRGKNTLSCR